MSLLKTASLAVLFGSLYTIFRKYQSVVDIPNQESQFNHPMYHFFNIDCKASSYLSVCHQ